MERIVGSVEQTIFWLKNKIYIKLQQFLSFFFSHNQSQNLATTISSSSMHPTRAHGGIAIKPCGESSSKPCDEESSKPCGESTLSAMRPSAKTPNSVIYDYERDIPDRLRPHKRYRQIGQ